MMRFHAGKTPLIFSVTALALGGVAGNWTLSPFSSCVHLSLPQ
jgi:hypothetical protein